MNFLKRNIRVFLLGGFLFTAFMGVTEALNVIVVQEETILKAGGTIPFGVLWFIYEGLKLLFVVWVLKIMGVISFVSENSVEKELTQDEKEVDSPVRTDENEE